MNAAARYGIASTSAHSVRPGDDDGLAYISDVFEAGVTAVLEVDDLVARGLVAGLGDHDLPVHDCLSLVLRPTVVPPLHWIGVKTKYYESSSR